MKKFTKWLIDNGFTITHEYNKVTSKMNFEKGILRFTIDPTYSGNKAIWYNLYVKENSYITHRGDKDGFRICGRDTQKDLIAKLDEYIKGVK